MQRRHLCRYDSFYFNYLPRIIFGGCLLYQGDTWLILFVLYFIYLIWMIKATIFCLFVQGLSYAKSLLRKLLGTTESTNNNGERSRDVDDISSDAGSSSVGSQSTDEPSDVLSLTEIWLGRAELLQSLLGSGISTSLDDIADQLSSECLRDRLISDERYSMAVYMCKKCKVKFYT